MGDEVNTVVASMVTAGAQEVKGLPAGVGHPDVVLQVAARGTTVLAVKAEIKVVFRGGIGVVTSADCKVTLKARLFMDTPLVLGIRGVLHFIFPLSDIYLSRPKVKQGVPLATFLGNKMSHRGTKGGVSSQ